MVWTRVLLILPCASLWGSDSGARQGIQEIDDEQVSGLKRHIFRNDSARFSFVRRLPRGLIGRVSEVLGVRKNRCISDATVRSAWQRHD